MRHFGNWLLLAFMLVAIAACNEKQETKIASQPDVKQVVSRSFDFAQITRGGKLYQQNCAVCHGENGEGHAALAQAPALNESEHAWHHPDGQLQEIIQNGGVEMPSFEETLENDEIKAVIRYFQTFWRPDQLQVQQANSTQYPFR